MSGLISKYFYLGKKFFFRRKSFYLFILFICATQILDVLFPKITGHLVMVLQQTGVTAETVAFLPQTPWAAAVLFLICGVAALVCRLLCGVVERFLESGVSRDMRQAIHDRTLVMAPGFFNENNSAECMMNIDSGNAVAMTLANFFSLPLIMISGTGFGIVMLIDSLRRANIPWWLIALLIPFILLQPLCGYWLGELTNRAFAGLRKDNINVRNELINSFHAPLEIQQMDSVKQRSAVLQAALKSQTVKSIKANCIGILENQLSGSFILIVQVLVAFIAVIKYSDGSAAVAGIVECFLLIPAIFSQISDLVSIYTMQKQSEVDVDAVYAILHREPEVKDVSDAVGVKFTSAPSVVLDAVSFGYTAENMVLNDLSLNIPAGKLTAVTANSGGGKSTLFHLISRVHTPSGGRILLDDNDLSQIKLECLRSQLVKVSQFPLFIQGSLRENFRLQKADVTDEEIAKVCRETGIIHLFEKENGNIGDFQLTLGAENLSGGQRRLLSIARAMLKDPAVLLLDEPTTGVDAQTVSQVILPCLQKLKSGRTILLVDHNMNFVRNLADMVLVLDQGRVADFGETEAVWSKEDSLFRQLWEEYNRNQAQMVPPTFCTGSCNTSGSR
jgi:ABC-type multidrug transport system fused ATPase/permease subunit